MVINIKDSAAYVSVGSKGGTVGQGRALSLVTGMDQEMADSVIFHFLASCSLLPSEVE